MRRIALALLLSGCGSGIMYRSCPLDRSKIEGARRGDYKVLQWDADAVVQGLLSSGLATQDDACALVHSQTIRVMSAEYAWDTLARSETGLMITAHVSGAQYPDDNRIEISRNLKALAHEFLHAYEFARGINVDGDPHAGWVENAAYQHYLNGYQRRRGWCSLNWWDNLDRPQCEF